MSKDMVCYCPATDDLFLILENSMGKFSDAHGKFYMYFVWGTKTFVKLYIICEL